MMITPIFSSQKPILKKLRGVIRMRRLENATEAFEFYYNQRARAHMMERFAWKTTAELGAPENSIIGMNGGRWFAVNVWTGEIEDNIDTRVYNKNPKKVSEEQSNALFEQFKKKHNMKEVASRLNWTLTSSTSIRGCYA